MRGATAESRRVPFLLHVRTLRLLWRMLGHVAVAALAVAAAYLLGGAEDLRNQVLVACAFLLGYSLLLAVLSEALSPLRPALRMVPLDDRAALRVQGALGALLTVLLLTELGAWLVRANGWVPSVAELLAMVRNTALLVFLAAGLVAGGAVRRLSSALGEGTLGFLVRFALRVLLPLAFLTAVFQIVTRGLGYLPLASWMLERVYLMSAQLALVALTYRLARSALRRAVTLGGAKVEGATQQPSPAAIGIERIATGLLRLVLLALGAWWVLSRWGIRAEGLARWLASSVVPGGTLLWGQLVGGVARVGLVLLVGWLLRNVLTFFLFPRARMDVGARYAVLAVLRYAVGVLVVFFALAGLGVETSSLAWFLGAAGIGLGLGLQDVLGNFFSGLVMLVERPVRVGDFVVVGDAAGTVEAIRIRGTLIRTPENTTVLVPNRQMLGERVANLSYGIPYRRVQVAVGVAYEADPARVRNVLLEIARRHPLVAADPTPFVQLQGFGESSLDFVLFAQSRSPLEVFQVASDLRFQILADFRREGIEIPFPRRDLRVLGETAVPVASTTATTPRR